MGDNDGSLIRMVKMFKLLCEVFVTLSWPGNFPQGGDERQVVKNFLVHNCSRLFIGRANTYSNHTKRISQACCKKYFMV